MTIDQNTPTAAQADGLEVVAWQWNAPLGGGVVHDETAAQVFSINAGGLAVEPLVRQSEAAAIISSLRAENERLRDTNRKMHRRLQLAEAMPQSIIASAQAWIDYFKLHRPARPDRALFRWFITDVKKRAARQIIDQEAGK